MYLLSCRHYRRLLIKTLEKDLQEELEFVTDVICDHPKNYQVWFVKKGTFLY